MPGHGQEATAGGWAFTCSLYEFVLGWPWVGPRWLVELCMVGAGARGLIVAEYRVGGLSPDVVAELMAEAGPLWQGRHQARLAARPGRSGHGDPRGCWL